MPCRSAYTIQAFRVYAVFLMKIHICETEGADNIYIQIHSLTHSSLLRAHPPTHTLRSLAYKSHNKNQSKHIFAIFITQFPIEKWKNMQSRRGECGDWAREREIERASKASSGKLTLFESTLQLEQSRINIPTD